MQRSQSWIIPTVMSPEKGGPVYNQLRANFAYTRRMIQRHPFRWIHDNWDFERHDCRDDPRLRALHPADV